MSGDATALAQQVSALEAEVRALKEALAASVTASSLPLVEMLVKDNARRREAETQLARAEAWVQLAQQNGGVGAYQYDVRTDQLYWSAVTYGVYGLDPSRTRASLEAWLGAIHPDDRAEVQAHAMAAIEVGAPVDQEFRVRLSDGGVRWIKDRGRVEVDAEGRPQRVVGMNIDITDLKDAQAALAGSEARFRYTFEHARVGVAHVGLDGQFLRVNRYLCEMLGRTPAELMASSFQDITYPDDLPSDLDNVRRMLAGEIDHYAMEKRYLRRGGEIVWTDLCVSLRRHADGTPANFISVIVDTRQRKQAEERLRLIMGELAHRSRNALTVIQSVIRLSSRNATSVTDFRDSLLKRLSGMTAAQDLLVGNERESAPLRALIEAQIAVFLPGDSDRVGVAGPDVHLQPAAVHAIGLAIHELATNACKHGALSGETGSVAVTWAIGADGGLELTWTESGGPPVVEPTRTGFGRRVLERMIEVSLGATATVAFHRAGLVWMLAMPRRFLAPASGAGDSGPSAPRSH